MTSAYIESHAGATECDLLGKYIDCFSQSVTPAQIHSPHPWPSHCCRHRTGHQVSGVLPPAGAWTSSGRGVDL